MGIGLVNQRLAGQGGPTFRVKPARPSIAEDAKFITKPLDRVSFEIVTGSDTGTPLPGSGSSAGKDIPLPGSGKVSPEDINGRNIQYGSLGKDGVTATITRERYGGETPRVEMTIDHTPEKDFSFTPTQEEGRQTNRANTTHFSMQYDSYGRPRIGFSREPYDFAATKYIQKTSQIRFEQNVASSKEALTYINKGSAPVKLDEREIVPTDPNQLKPLVKSGIGVEPIDIKLLGQKVEGAVEPLKPLTPDKLLGESEVDTEPKAVAEKTLSNEAVKAIAQELDIDFTKVLRPESSQQAQEAHDLKTKDTAQLISLSV